jgi:hypothetical protein
MATTKNCVFCNTTDNLNTEMSVTLEDGNKVQAWVCDQHAEEATVKSVREAYCAKLDKFKELLEAAKALGFDLSAIAGKPEVAPQPKPQEKPRPVTEKAPSKPQMVELEDNENVVDTARLDNARAFISTGGQTEYGSVQGFSNYSLDGGKDKLSPELRQGKAHLAMMEGRDGQPLIIPDKRVDGTGVTTIKIVKNTNDDVLQRRFKQMAKDSMEDKVPDFAHNGYSATTKECPFCRGQGTILNAKKLVECPKCHGSGLLSSL